MNRRLALAFAGLLAAASAAVATAAPKSFKDCATCPEMVVVPAGSFMMGSPETENPRDPDEALHKVTLKRFAMSKYPITWDEFEACHRDGACDGTAVETALRTDLRGQPIQKYVDHGRGRRPVVGLSWWDAQRFVGWLNEKAGKEVYSLPSESQFEYAARAGTTTVYYWGDKPDHDYANFGKSVAPLGGEAAGRDVWVESTSPVGAFPPNAFGLYDMAGNVYQWTQDCYEKDALKLPVDGSAVTDGNCFMRVMRSNSYESDPKTLRSANRAGQYPPNLRGRNYLGFRVVKRMD
jgi:formylglycine-generating enzyme required for sulfatase activity